MPQRVKGGGEKSESIFDQSVVRLSLQTGSENELKGTTFDLAVTQTTQFFSISASESLMWLSLAAVLAVGGWEGRGFTTRCQF